MKENKQERKVVHLQMDDTHEYFGSIAQVFKKYTAEQLGISLYTVKNNLARLGMIQTDKCIIRLGWLQTAERNEK